MKLSLKKVLEINASDSSTEVESSTLSPEVEGSNPTVIVATFLWNVLAAYLVNFFSTKNHFVWLDQQVDYLWWKQGLFNIKVLHQEAIL